MNKHHHVSGLFDWSLVGYPFIEHGFDAIKERIPAVLEREAVKPFAFGQRLPIGIRPPVALTNRQYRNLVISETSQRV